MRKPAGREAEMEPGIWGHLPEELLERIIALLPLRAIVSLRPTCKRFNSLLLSPSFLSLLPHSHSPSAAAARHHSPSDFLLLSHPLLSPRHIPVYDSAAGSWRTLSLPSSSLILCSSSSGLLCFTSSSFPSPSLVVSNLLTGSSRTLRLPVQLVAAATLVSLPSPAPTSTHGYKLFVPSSDGTVFLYDSGDESWVRFDGFDQVLLAENAHQEGVLFKGSIYFACEEPFRVVGFDLATGTWDPLAAELPEEVTFLRLVSSGDGLYLVGGVGRDGIARSLRVWQLGVVAGGGSTTAGAPLQQWRELGRLPEMMCRKFWSVCYHNYGHLQCFWHGGMVCVGCTTWPEVLLYRVGRGTWHWLPRCPMLPERSSCGFRWFSFVPDLHALV